MVLSFRALGLACCSVAGLIPVVALSAPISRASQTTFLLGLALSIFVWVGGLAALHRARVSKPSTARSAALDFSLTAVFAALLAFYSVEHEHLPRLVAFGAWCCLLVTLESHMSQAATPGSGSSDAPAASAAGFQKPLLQAIPAGKSSDPQPSPRSPLLDTPLLRSLSKLGSFSASLSFILTPAHAPVETPWTPPQSPTVDDAAAPESEAAQLLACLGSDDLDRQQQAAKTVKERSRDRELQSTLLDAGALPVLVCSCRSSDASVSRNARTALFNISLEELLKPKLAGAVSYLADAMADPAPEVSELACATVYSLSTCRDLAMVLLEKGAIPPLVRILLHGQEPARLDACKALFNLARCWDVEGAHESVVGEIAAAGGVAGLVELLEEPCSPLAGKAVLVLRNMVKSGAGCAVLAAVEDGVPNLVAALEAGNPGMQESAAAILLTLAQREPSYRRMVWEEAPMMALEMLQCRGTPRARQKAALLLQLLSTSGSDPGLSAGP